ncbi:fructokinase [Philodulcilactobacillus myokoensis]|uniref:Fructokinase n=1 Tax=Philodulcilactobacillus myokoensis TaxID=2929573 RepID=A0A9W6B0S2_9LACO|nr:fructokinase ScrK [Philodulcilactobacillus myokoensis]GLB46049.1 fructokinase [Philodulcilactobacillus myokoensis]
MLLGSIEAGGTKFICAVGDEHYHIVDKVRIPTETPDVTLKKTVEYFKQFKNLEAISIASFGPIEVRHHSKKYGYILDTPKISWSNVNFLGYLKQNFSIPMYWTTDVNGSAYGEYIKASENHEKIRSLIYYTIGTGVGAGGVINGKFIGILGHPEVGHVNVKRHPDDLKFPGICPYHGDCLEGLVSGPTFEARLGKKGPEVPITNHVWDIMAYYVAQALIQITLMIRPERLVLGGGVLNETFLKKIRKQFSLLMNGYIKINNLSKYIQLPSVKNNGSATLGNFALAMHVLKQTK